MTSEVHRSIAISRQAMLIACLLFLAGAPRELAAQTKRFRPNPNYVQLGAPDQAEGRRILEEFRHSGIQANYYWEFQLRVMPRRGEETVVNGKLWAGQGEHGTVTRVVLAPAASGGSEQRLLIESGPEGRVWTLEAGKLIELGENRLFEKLPPTDLTAFDLQMPFLGWPDFVFEGVVKLRGRPAHSFLTYPPKDLAQAHPELTGVRVYLDTQFHAPVQVEQLGAEGRVLKSSTVLDLKKVGGDWIVKEVDFRDETTRGKTRFVVTAAATRLDFSATLFEPDSLAQSIGAPDSQRIEQLGP